MMTEDLSPGLRARIAALSPSQRRRLADAMVNFRARGRALDLTEADAHHLLDEIVKPTPPTEFEVLEALTLPELEALVSAQAFADLSQPVVDAAVLGLIRARREKVVATFNIPDIIARIDRRRVVEEANPDSDVYQP